SRAELLGECVGGLVDASFVRVRDDDASTFEQTTSGERSTDARAGGGGDDDGLSVEQSSSWWFDGCRLRHGVLVVSCGAEGRAGPRTGCSFVAVTPQRGSRGSPSARSPITLRWISSD